MSVVRALLPALIVCLFAFSAAADDWPAWRGPNRDGICKEKSLLQTWPDGGPKLAWTAKGLGEGFSGPAVVGKMLYTMGDIDGKECVLALDVSQQGKIVWTTPIGPIRHKGAGHPGPRATPTIDGDKLYTLGINGDLVCMNTRDGKIVWQKSLVGDAGGSVPQWGYAESPLIDGPWVLCTPGGKKATLVAWLKTNGKPVWGSTIGDGAAYASIIKVNAAGMPQYVTLTAQGIVGVSAKDGKFMWRYDKAANKVANCTTCVADGDIVFGGSNYGNGSGAVTLKKGPKGVSADELYFTKKMKNHHGGFVLVNGSLYGADDPGLLTCLDFKTGDVKWQERKPGKCSVLFADGRLYCRDEKGPLTLVEANPDKYVEHGRFNQPSRSDRNAWPHPVIANGMLYIRDQDVLLCFDVRGKK